MYGWVLVGVCGCVCGVCVVCVCLGGRVVCGCVGVLVCVWVVCGCVGAWVCGCVCVCGGVYKHISVCVL